VASSLRKLEYFYDFLVAIWVPMNWIDRGSLRCEMRPTKRKRLASRSEPFLNSLEVLVRRP
jgi:hypothetical protein